VGTTPRSVEAVAHCCGGVRLALRKLCHTCDTKPVFTAKTDIIDDSLLLILRNLLKTLARSKIPAYMAHPLFFQ
jgi:hypothetical protein